MAVQKRRRDNLKREPLGHFHPAVAAWFRSALGEPTPAQSLAWPPIAEGKTTLLLAPTGSGKTLAAFLSAIDRLARTPEPDPERRLRVLYVSPLKALAVDIERNLRAPLAGISAVGGHLGAELRRLDVAVRTGDTPAPERARMVKAPPDILITTPESLYLLLTSRQRRVLTSVDTVIVDEIHQMAASKRGSHLFLSLERLEALRRATGATRPLQRVGLSATQRPLDEIARLLGGLDVKGRKLRPRPVEIVDASAKKALSVTVEVPPPLPPPAPEMPEEHVIEAKASIWPGVHAFVVDRVRRARSTMIFVNSRRLAERLATALNETAEEEIALAHHGSVAKDARRVTEDRLKAGDLPAIVATSSLELGIDMGAVDQVIQIEAPLSVASGIQRIGRASHHVGGVPSGILVPKHPHDLLACAAAAAAIEEGDVEETRYARNPLDVLSQHIVAIAAIGLSTKAPSAERKGRLRLRDERPPETNIEELWDLVRSAAPFADLPRTSFEGVLDMLSGRYPSDEFADLKPRITWDRKRGTITPRTGSLRLAICNGGTIPDRGLYGVFLEADAANDGEVARGSSKGKPSRRVGELDEEMVFELREGEVFLLGASSWRVAQITRDRVLVQPAAGVPGKMPFWRGDGVGRPVSFGVRIGKLTRRIAAATAPEACSVLERAHHLNERAARDLVDYIHDEKQAVGAVPSDRTIVVERVPDELGDLRICVLSPFGSRIHAPWAMAALQRLREARAGDIEVVWSDDGIVFRVPGGESPPATDLLFPSSTEIEEIVTREVATSSLFAARFREAAARALLLPRRTMGKRTPLWAQRKRSADLLAVASRYPGFPILLETYREVLRDAFDLHGLVDLLRSIESRTVRVRTVDTHTPSRFAASLLYGFVGNFVYDDDAPAAERRAHALLIDHAQLRELIGETEIRKLLDADVIAEHERRLQRLDRPLRSADAIHDLLLWVGDLSAEEIARRCTGDDGARWIRELSAERRIVRARLRGETRFVAIEDAARYRDALGVVLERGLPDVFVGPTKDAFTTLVARYARTHTPFEAGAIAERWGVGEADVEVALETLVGRGTVTRGAFLPLEESAQRRLHAVEYVDVDVLRALKQKTLARLRKAVEPVSSETFARFLMEWQGCTSERSATPDPRPLDSLLHVIGQLEGCPIPASILEGDVLAARVPGFWPHHLDQLLATGEIVWAGISPLGSNDGRIALYTAENEALLSRHPSADEALHEPIHVEIRKLFERRGAIFFAEIVREIGGYPGDVLDALWDLVWSGEVTNDSFEPLRSRARGNAPTRNARRSRALHSRSGPAGSEGRWSLRRARWEREPEPTERRAATARALLERYGVVLREVASVEGLPGGFGYVYDVYRAMEEQGRARRGYFVSDRGGTQFALPGAEERLRAARDDGEDSRPRVTVLAAADPANPWGALLPWPATNGRSSQRTPGARVLLVDGRLLAWLSRGTHHITTFLSSDEPARSNDVRTLTEVLAGQHGHQDHASRTTMIATIDGIAAPESPLSSAFANVGFVARQGSLVRLPSSSHVRPPRRAWIAEDARPSQGPPSLIAVDGRSEALDHEPDEELPLDA